MSKYVVMTTEDCGCSEATFRDSFDVEFSGTEHETREEAMKELMEAKFDPDYVGYCFYIHEVEVMNSPAGYYLGTRTPEGFPNCRISGYCQNKELAPYLVMSRQWGCIENEYCNEGNGCFE